MVFKKVTFWSSRRYTIQKNLGPMNQQHQEPSCLISSNLSWFYKNNFQCSLH